MTRGKGESCVSLHARKAENVTGGNVLAARSDVRSMPKKIACICAVVYGLFLMCTSVLLWGGFLSVVPAGSDAAYRAASYFACAFAHPIGLFIVAGAAYLRPSSRAWRHPAVALAMVVAAGVLLGFQVWRDAYLPAVGAATGGLLGCASAFFFCALQELVANLRVYAAGIVVFCAAAISALAYLLMGALPADVQVWLVAFVCFPLVTALCVAARKVGPAFRHPMFQAAPSNGGDKILRAAIDLWRPLLCVAFSALLIGIIRADTIIDGGALNGVNDSGMLGLLLSSIVLLGCWRMIYTRTLLSKLQLLIFPLIATSFLLLPFLTGQSRGLFVSIAFTVFSITSSLMVVTCARTARMYALPPVLVFGAFSGVVYLFLACGALLSYSFGGLREATSLWLFAIALVAIYVLSMALTLGRRLTDGVRRTKAARDVARASAKTNAFSNNFVLLGAEADRSGEGGGDARHAGDAALRGEERARPHMADNAAKNENGGAASRAKGAVVSRMHGDADRRAPREPSDPSSGAMGLERKCAGVAKHYGLTARETEVMTLLAHGRDVAFIADELTLSKNTVRTHAKGVFSKMGVHSKQELIDVVYLFEE